MAYARIKCGLGASLLVALLVFAPKPAQAQVTQTWAGGTGNWSASNWTGGTGTAWETGSNAVFSVTGGGTVTAGAESVGSISFANTTGYTITGGTLTRSSPSIVASSNAAHVSTINSVLAGSSASIGLTKTASGILSLGGTNTYAGNTTISAGWLRAVDGVGLPSNSRLVFDGGTFEGSGTFTRANATSGAGTFGYNSGKNVNFSANGGKLTIRIGNDASIAQTIDGQNAPAANTFRGLNFLGGTTGNAEIDFQNNLNMGGATRVIDVQGGDGSGGFFVTLSGVITNGGLQRQGTGGKVVLTGVNTYTLGTTLNQANTTVLGNKSALGTGAITSSSTATIQAGVDLSGADKISNALTITNSITLSGSNNLDIGGIVTNSGGNRSITSSITGGGLLTLSGTVKLQEDAGLAGRFLTIAGTGNTTISGPIVDGGTGGNGAITLTNSGITTLSGANTYTGTTTVSAGTLRIGGSGTLGNVSTGIGDYAGSISIANTRSLVYASSASQTLGGVISGAGGALSAEAGTLSLTGANTYTGATTVSGGTLLVNGSGSLAASAVTVNSGAFGGSGSIGSTLSLLGSSSFHVVDLFDPLQVTGTINLYAGFGVGNLVGIDWSTVAFNTYTLIGGTLGAGVFDGLNNNSLATAQDVGSGRLAYFQQGSLQLVVANVPEPSAALLGVLAPLLGTLTLLRRRRSGSCPGPR